MAFDYHSENDITLTKSQEELLDTIENLRFQFEGVSKLKDLRDKNKLLVYVADKLDKKR